MFKKSSLGLNKEESAQFSDLLNHFQDVFAKHEFDLGTFKTIKQRMRRTPAHFVGEEEAHLKKMLDAGVIQESISDWASAPVLIRKNKFCWGDDQENSFGSLKRSVLEPPVLALPNQKDPFILDTNASDVAIGAELIQVQNGEEKVIAYGSYALTKEQRRYCTSRKELLAVVRFTRQYRHYLLGQPFLVRTDHSSLTWLLRFKEPQGQLARWMEELSQYNMALKHRAGAKHGNADALSRRPAPGVKCRACERVEDLPCGGCDYCKRVNCQWGNFTREVDDVRPLVLPMSDETDGLYVNPEPDHATALRLEVSEGSERLQEITGREETMTNDCTARMLVGRKEQEWK